MEHSYIVPERIDQLWRHRQTSLPSIPYWKYEFPNNIDYYRYLDEKTLKQHLERLEALLNELRKSVAQTTKALDWYHAMTSEEFKNFLELVPWIFAPIKGLDITNLDDRLLEIKLKCNLDGCDRDKNMELLLKQYDCLRQQIDYLREIIGAIKNVASSQPKPEPFISLGREAYRDGEVVVGVYDDKYDYRRPDYPWSSPCALIVADSTVGTYHMKVRPLTKKELRYLPIDLPTKAKQYWMKRASYDWVMPLEAYRYYLERPGLADEHLEVLKKSGLIVSTTKLKILTKYLKK